MTLLWLKESLKKIYQGGPGNDAFIEPHNNKFVFFFAVNQVTKELLSFLTSLFRQSC